MSRRRAARSTQDTDAWVLQRVSGPLDTTVKLVHYHRAQRVSFQSAGEDPERVWRRCEFTGLAAAAAGGARRTATLHIV
eukprot:4581262-Prymnesium_polylepis.1